MASRTLRVAMLVAAVLALGACAKPMFLRGDLKEKATKAADDYSTNLRWGRLPEAAKFVEPLRRSEFLQFFAEGHRYRFTDIDVSAVDYDRAEMQAHATVRFTLYTMPRVKEISVVDSQRWRYDSDEDAWYVDPDLESFRSLKR
ncbi:MAG: hypothetical protein JRG76_20050 [Deltaproteobacteria bacterium]|nr:hypothetical protein [Deltaproteobacteria bacterium]